uniref:VP11 n=1 Tax=Eyach virus TaxID=62352 RepID=A0A8G0QEE0_9REOV|nr:VP11 [Eyach virus]
MPALAIIGDSLLTASLIDKYVPPSSNAQVFGFVAHTHSVKPLIPQIIGIPEDSLMQWPLFTEWARKNEIDLTTDETFKEILDIGKRLVSGDVMTFVFRQFRGRTEVGYHGKTENPRDRPSFFPLLSACAVDSVKDLLYKHFEKWVYFAPKPVVEWVIEQEIDLSTVEFDVRNMLKMLSNNPIKWERLLDSVRDVAESRLNAGGQEVGEWRAWIIGLLMVFGQSLKVGGLMAVFLEVEALGARLLLELLARVKTDPGAVPHLQSVNRELKVGWRVAPMKREGRNYAIRLNARPPQMGGNFTIESGAFKA